MSASQLWYVQTTFGTVLGPLSDETLNEMVRSGDLVSNDLVRQSENDEWTLAAELPGLMNAGQVVTKRKTETFAVANRETPPEQIAPAVNPVVIANEPVADECHTLPTAQTDSSLQTIPEQPSPISTTAPDSHKPIVPQPPKVALPHARRTPHVTDIIQDKLKWAKQRMSGKMWLVAASLIVIAWWSWPRTNQNICNQLLAIKTGLIEHRGDPDKKNDLESFASQALAELNAQIPSLESKARWGNREANYLLLASRDCLKPMLENASRPQEDLETKLDDYLWALRSYYDGQPLGDPKPPAPAPEFSNPDGVVSPSGNSQKNGHD